MNSRLSAIRMVTYEQHVGETIHTVMQYSTISIVRRLFIRAVTHQQLCRAVTWWCTIAPPCIQNYREFHSYSHSAIANFCSRVVQCIKQYSTSQLQYMYISYQVIAKSESESNKSPKAALQPLQSQHHISSVDLILFVSSTVRFTKE